MRRKERLTPQDFDTLKDHMGSRWKAANIEAVRRVMVEGCKQKDIAADLGVTEKAVSQMVKKAYDLHQEHGTVPVGWVSVYATLPPDLAELVKTMEQQARATLSRGKQ
ncbi:TPA: TrfB-related DNA-binding protein [Enterobacter hormaechei]